MGVPLKEFAKGEGEWDPYANSLHTQLGSILGHLEILPTLAASTAASDEPSEGAPGIDALCTRYS